MTTLFFVPPSAIHGERIILPPEETHHALRVLRMQPGDEITVVDGEGGWYRAEIELIGKKEVLAHVRERRREVGEAAYELTVGLALLKNAGRFETFLEKAVEMGVHTIVPLITTRTEKPRMKAARAERLLVAAMKQCGRSRLVRLAAPTTFGDVMAADPPDLAMIAHEKTGPEHALAAVLADHPDARRITLLVGPEGGFTDAEVADAEARGYRAVSLGPRRLRAETAAMVGAAGVMLARGGDAR